MLIIGNLIVKNQARWEAMKINPAHLAAITTVAKRLQSNEALYQAVTTLTHVPWWAVAVIHEREASGNFHAYLGNGQPLDRKTTIVPLGRGPFATFNDGAVDALVNCPPFASKWKDWSPGGSLTVLTEYNGLGYDERGIPSPYIWSMTNQYVRGKFVGDHDFDPNAVDTQMGCAALLSIMGVFH
jgi:lysozyme family protein